MWLGLRLHDTEETNEPKTWRRNVIRTQGRFERKNKINDGRGLGNALAGREVLVEGVP
jgi:hypothetical protein